MSYDKFRGHRSFKLPTEFLSLKIILVLANSLDRDEMLHYLEFYLGLYVFYLLRGFQFTNGK